MLEKTFRILRIFFALASAAALAAYVWLAAFIRPTGDDYCISARLIGFDPLTASLIKYWYTSNRFSNEIVAWFSDLFGPRGAALLAALSLLLWLAGLTWLLYEAARLLRLRWDFWTGLLLAELVALVSYYTAPNLFQSVQWRPGLMTYFLPLVIFSFIFAGILRGTRVLSARAGLRAAIVILFFAAFFTGGLSETAGALHISILGLALVANFLWNKTPTRAAALVLVSATLAGALLAMIGMLVTPANAIRLDAAAAPSMLDIVARSLTYAVQFLSEAVRLLKLPLGFTLLAGAALAYCHFRSDEVSLPRRAWLGLILVPLLTYVLIVAAFAPSAYGQSFPVDRVRFPAHVLLAASALTFGGLLGLFAARLPQPRGSAALVALALFVLALYPLWTIRNNYKLIPQYQHYAARWDARDAQIRSLAASGERDIVTFGLPGVAGVNDLGPRPGHWINYCAAIVYGVDSISASQESP